MKSAKPQKQRLVKATAPGKVILFGEHAVVYGHSAIAAPLSELRATAIIQTGEEKGVLLIAPDLGIRRFLTGAEKNDALALAVLQVQQAAAIGELPDMIITVSSEIPIASGLGSGASITVAIIRALASYLGMYEIASDEWVSRLTFEVEKYYHGTPSGIDNTVVSYERPVYFKRSQPQDRIETFTTGQPLSLLIADTGVSSHTKEVVSAVRASWQADRARFEAIFTGCGSIAEAARLAIAAGDLPAVGRLMSENHKLLVDMTVSSQELNKLVTAAEQAGAYGAKLSGAGRGGNMIALVDQESEVSVQAALLKAGARSVLYSRISS